MIFDYRKCELIKKKTTLFWNNQWQKIYNIKIFREQEEWSFYTSTGSYLNSTIKIVWKLHPSVLFAFQIYSSLLSLWNSPVSSW